MAVVVEGRPVSRVQELLTELAVRHVALNYPQLVEACKVAILLRLLKEHGIELDAAAMDEALAAEQVASLEALLERTKPKPPNLYLARRL